MPSKLHYLRDKKLSPTDEIRTILAGLEAMRPRFGSLNATQVLGLLRDLDRLYQLFYEVEAKGVDLPGEKARFETVQAQVRRAAEPLLKALGGPAALSEFRPRPNPERARWWWYMHEDVAARQRKLVRRLLIGGIALFVLLAGAWLLIETVLAPNPAAVARLEAETAAFDFLSEGEPVEALRAVERGLAVAVEEPTLLVLQGVLQEKLGQPEAAQRSFATAEAALPPFEFLIVRAQYYLRANEPEKAELDALDAVEMDEESALAWLVLGQSLEAQGRTFDAITPYETAGQLALDNGEGQIVVMARLALGRLGVGP